MEEGRGRGLEARKSGYEKGARETEMGLGGGARGRGKGR